MGVGSGTRTVLLPPVLSETAGPELGQPESQTGII